MMISVKSTLLLSRLWTGAVRLLDRVTVHWLDRGLSIILTGVLPVRRYRFDEKLREFRPLNLVLCSVTSTVLALAPETPYEPFFLKPGVCRDARSLTYSGSAADA